MLLEEYHHQQQQQNIMKLNVKQKTTLTPKIFETNLINNKPKYLSSAKTSNQLCNEQLLLTMIMKRNGYQASYWYISIYTCVRI